MPDVYQIVTDRIINALSFGEIPWHRPWCSVDGGAYSRVTGRPYSLLNQMLLSHTGEYASLKQWIAIGGKIRKGEKPEIIVFWKWPEKTVKRYDGNEEEEKTVVTENPILRYYRVFHISQVEGVAPNERKVRLYDTKAIDRAEKLLKVYCIREGIQLECEPSNEAYYSPNRDVIHIPDIRQFPYAEEYYSIALHEAIHSTGHATRLNRKGLQTVTFGSKEYSKEELIAEIGSACLMNHLGIETDRSFMNATGYIQGWLSVLSNDKKIIVISACQAEKSAKYIVGQ